MSGSAGIPDAPVVNALPVTSPPLPETTNLLGVRVVVSSPDDLAMRLVRIAGEGTASGHATYVCAASVHTVIEATRDRSFRRVLNGALAVAPDGMPLAWLGRLRGHRRMRRIRGPSLMKRVCQLSVERGIPHFLYGAAPGVVEELARRLKAEYPGLNVVGTHTPPFRPLSEVEEVNVVRLINDSGARIVWVGLGTPKQERWMAAMAPRLTAGLLIGVGAAFDFHSGRLAEAPPWIQRSGLEWFFRLTQEPRRLWRRYLYANPLFVAYAILQLLHLKRFADFDT